MDGIKTLTEGKAAPSFMESLTGMFGKGFPEGLNASLVTAAGADWKNYWIFPAGMAGAVAVIFFLLFWDKSADGEDSKP